MAKKTIRHPLACLLAGLVLLGGAGIIAITSIGGAPAKAMPYPCGLSACRTGATKVPLRAFEGAYVAADPTDPAHVVIADTDLINSKCTWHTSFDGGRTWLDGVFALPSGFSGCRIDAPSGGHVPSGSVGIGVHGTVYAVFGSANAADNRRESILIATSLDRGRTFGPATVAVAAPAGIGLARPLMTLAKAPRGGDSVLLSFWACQAATGGTACDAAMFDRSDDGGETFATPVVVNGPPGGQNPSQPAVGTDGSVYMTFQRRFSNGPVNLVLARSTDRGATFSETPIDTELGLGVSYDPAKLVVDARSGALYSVWSDNRTGTQQIFLRKSTDKGATWSQATLLTPVSPPTGYSRSPSIAIAPDGRIDVVYYYTDAQQPTFDEVFLDSSGDGGATFQASQVNPKPIDRALGYSGPAASLGMVGNHYPPTVAALDSAAYVVWSDTANATPLTQTQDVEFRTVFTAASSVP